MYSYRALINAMNALFERNQMLGLHPNKPNSLFLFLTNVVSVC